MRILEGKDEAIIIDHAGNVIRHGLPDKERVWSLDAREKRPKLKNPDDDIPLRYCIKCTQPYSRLDKVCPYCNTLHIPAGRSKPEHVDGDLTELTPEVLAAMRADVSKIDMDPNVVGEQMRRAGAPEVAWRSAIKKCAARQGVQGVLRDQISWWAAYQRDIERMNDSQIYKKFYFNFGIDIMTAQTLGSKDATELTFKITENLGTHYGSR